MTQTTGSTSSSSSGGSSLNLSASQKAALAVLESLADLVQHREAVPAVLSVGSLGAQMLQASAAVVSATLPDCPYEPRGRGIDANRWSFEPPPRMLERCRHTQAEGGPHCWDKVGNPVTC